MLGILSPFRRPTAKEWAEHPTAVELARLGWVDGQTLNIVPAYAEGREDRIPELARELVAKRVDVIWARGPEAAVAAARATQSIPIVFANVAFPVEMGLVDSLAQPGRNSTGVAYLAGDGSQVAKPVEYVRQIAPGITRIASLWSAHNLRTLSGEEYKQGYVLFEQWMRSWGFEYRMEYVATSADYEAAFTKILDWRAEAIIALTTPLNFRERDRITDFARRARLPSAHDTRYFVESGGLVSYGPDLTAIALQSVRHLDRVLRGARPSELAVELPNKIELAVNLSTARVLGLTVPQSLLLRADKVIEQ